jgi:hypothetical protein
MGLALIVFVSVAIIIALETFRMHRRNIRQREHHTHSGEPIMGNYHEISETAVGQSRRVGAAGMEFEAGESLNDVAALREQDQAIAQLSEQLNRMGKTPWSIAQVADCDLYNDEIRLFGSDIRKVAWQLTRICNPVAVAGTQGANVGSGTVMWVEVGAHRVATKSRKHQKEVMDALNGEYTRIASSYRSRILAQIHEYARGGDRSASIPLAAAVTVVKCGQTYVACESAEEARNLLAELTASYESCIKDAASVVMAELVRASAPKAS